MGTSKYEGAKMMDWTQTITLMITMIGSAYYIHRDIKEDMKSQTARTDKLYEMFIDLLKEGKK
jgi:hypothetical protein